MTDAGARDLFGSQCVDDLPLEAYLSSGRSGEPADRAQRGGLARPVAADERDDLTVADLERDVAQSLDPSIEDIDVSQLQQRRRSGAAAGRSWLEGGCCANASSP
jgi:hypothetical protein